MIKRILIASTVLIGAGAAWPAVAGCMDEITRLEERLSQLPPDQERQEEVTVKTTQGEVEVEGEVSGEAPAERWFHEPRSAEGVAEHLDHARALAEDGEEDGCLEQVQQAERILSGLES